MKRKLGILIFFLSFLILIGCGKVLKNEFIFKNKYEDLLEQIGNNETIDVISYTIYGKHFNIVGSNEDIIFNDNSKIVLKSLENEREYDIYIDENSFNTTKYINQGILLDNIPVGNYLVLLKHFDNDHYVYYNLVNKTTYNDLEYYTLTKNNQNNRIRISFGHHNDYSYMYLEVEKTKLPDDVYDIIVDPGHGGVDPGAVNGKYHEDDINLEYGLMLKEALTDLGLKVKMTRESSISLKTYGHGSRTAIPYETKAKLMFSVHLNSTNVYMKNGGVEVYIACGDNPSFAKVIANNIVEDTSTVFSVNNSNRIDKGVYERCYSDKDIKESQKTSKKEGWTPYEIAPKTTYYYFIRETGGITTKAFADGRNPKYEANPYYNANYGVEAYLLELGYISNSKNLKILLNEKDRYIKAIKDSVAYYIENNN